MNKPTKFNFQFIGGKVGWIHLPRGGVKVYGAVYGPREIAEFEMSKADAMELARSILDAYDEKPQREEAGQ